MLLRLQQPFFITLLLKLHLALNLLIRQQADKQTSCRRPDSIIGEMHGGNLDYCLV
jgi:hypothetical protein